MIGAVIFEQHRHRSDKREKMRKKREGKQLLDSTRLVSGGKL